MAREGGAGAGDASISGIALEDLLSGKVPVEGLPPEVVAALGERIGFDPARLAVNTEKLAELRVKAAKARADAELEKVRADARISAERAKAAAAEDFYQSTRKWTGWAMGAVLAASVATLIAGFLPFVSSITKGDGLKGLAVVGGIGILRYTLLKFGVLAGNIMGWTLIVLTVAACVWLAVMAATWAWRRRLLKTADTLDADDPRAATALEAAAKGLDKPQHSALRKLMLFERGGPDAITLTDQALEALREKNINTGRA